MTLPTSKRSTLLPQGLALFDLMLGGKKLSIALLCCLAFNAHANKDNAEPVSPLPRVADAQVFAEFVDSYPAVLNYFTAATQANIIEFYQNQYGDILNQSLKRKRLTLFFAENNTRIRVVISQQNNKRQVDVLSELTTEASAQSLK